MDSGDGAREIKKICWIVNGVIRMETSLSVAGFQEQSKFNGTDPWGRSH